MCASMSCGEVGVEGDRARVLCLFSMVAGTLATSKGTLDTAFACLVNEGYWRREPAPRNGWNYHPVRPFTDDDARRDAELAAPERGGTRDRPILSVRNAPLITAGEAARELLRTAAGAPDDVDIYGDLLPPGCTDWDDDEGAAGLPRRPWTK
jgi:hypothetical protein